jgi:antitoxin VapB
VETRSVRIFRNGRNQAVRIPREFEFPGDEALLSREGEVLTLRPVKPRSLLAVLKSLKPLDDSLPPVRDRAPERVDL